MTSEEDKQKEQKEHYDAFVDAMSEIDRVEKLSEQTKDLRDNVKKDAIEALRKPAYEAILLYNQMFPDEPLIDTDIVDSADKLNSKQIELGLKVKRKTDLGTATTKLSGNLEDILSVMPENKLELIATSKEARDAVEESDREILAKYFSYKAAEDFSVRYKSGEAMNENDRAYALNAAMKGAYSKVSKAAKDKGFDEEMQSYLGQLAAIGVKSAHLNESQIRKYAGSGLENYVSDAKKAYEKAAGERKAVEIAKDGVRNLVKGDGKQFQTALGIVYGAAADKLKLSYGMPKSNTQDEEGENYQEAA